MFQVSQKKRYGRPDALFLTIFFVLVFFGLMVLGSASSDISRTKFGDSFFLLKKQIELGFLIGIIGFFIALKINYKKYEKISGILIFASLILLGLIFTPLGVKENGSNRWLNFGAFIIQPSEIIKLTSVIFFAFWLSKKNIKNLSFLKSFSFFGLLGIITILLLLEPATSVAVILIATSLIMYCLANGKLSNAFLATSICLAVLGGLIYLTPYRLSRFESFLNKEANLMSSGFHANQALIAIGSGGLAGVGFGQSTTKLSFLPEPYGDSIFAVLAEEFGFIGSITTLLLFGFLVLRIFILARKVSDKAGSYMLIGFGSLIGIQVIINIGAISGIFPLTGVPLPFMSYGNSSLIVFMTMGGIIGNISKQAK